MMKNLFKSLKLNQFLKSCFAFLLGLGLMAGVVFGNSSVAQASSHVTSAASASDAARINQRKEDAPHYPNWYEDQRSLESLMEDAGVTGPTGRNVGVNSQNDSQLDDQNHFLDRSKQGLKDVADTVQSKIQHGISNTASDPRDRTYRDVPEWYQDMKGDAKNNGMAESQHNLNSLRNQGMSGSSKTTYKPNYRDTQDYGVSDNDVRQKVGNAIESAKETFQSATEKAAAGDNPVAR